MNRFTSRTIALIAAFVIAAAIGLQAHAGDDDCAGPRLMQLDVVNLVEGQEVEGLPELALTHNKFTYQFADAQSLAKFKAAPEKYEIQLGGACARMGPLSGDGNTKLLAVHNGHVYLFASESCRKTFLSKPEKFLGQPDVVPTSTPDGVKRGRELINRAVEAIGGASRLDAIKTYRQEDRHMEANGDKGNVEVVHSLTLGFPEGVRTDDQWDTYKWSSVALTTKGWSTDSKGSNSLDKQQYDALLQDGRRHVLSILRARNKPGFVAEATGTGKVKPSDSDELIVDLVTVAFDGATATLGIDQTTGRVIGMSYRGRGSGFYFGDVQHVFSDFIQVGGLTLPSRVTVRFDGEPAPTSSVTFSALKIDDPADAKAFQRELNVKPK